MFYQQRRNDHKALAVSKRKHRKFVFEARVQRCNDKVPPAITFLKDIYRFLPLAIKLVIAV